MFKKKEPVRGSPLAALPPMRRKMTVAIWRALTNLKVKAATLDKLMPAIMERTNLTREDFRKEGVQWINETDILYISGAGDIFERPISYLGPTAAQEATIRSKYRELVERKKRITFSALAEIQAEEDPTLAKLKTISTVREFVNFEDLPKDERIYHIVCSEREGSSLYYIEEFHREMPAFMDKINKNTMFKRLWDERLEVFAEIMVDRIHKKDEGVAVLYIPLLSIDGKEIVYGPNNEIPNKRTRPIEEVEAAVQGRKVEELIEELRISDPVPPTVEEPPPNATGSHSENPPEQGDSNATFIVNSPTASQASRHRFFILPEISPPREDSSVSLSDSRQEIVNDIRDQLWASPASRVHFQSLSRNETSHFAGRPVVSQESQRLHPDASVHHEALQFLPNRPNASVLNVRNENSRGAHQSQRFDSGVYTAAGVSTVTQPQADVPPLISVVSSSNRESSAARAKSQPLRPPAQAQTATARSWNSRPQASMGSSRSFAVPRATAVASVAPPVVPVRSEGTTLPATNREPRRDLPLAPRPPTSRELPLFIAREPHPARYEPSEDAMETHWEAPDMYRHCDAFIPPPPPPLQIRQEPIVERFAERNDVHRSVTPPDSALAAHFSEHDSPILRRSNSPFIARPPEPVPVPQQQPQPTVLPQPAPIRRARSPERNVPRRRIEPGTFIQASDLPPPPVIPQRSLGNAVPPMSHSAVPVPKQQVPPTLLPQRSPPRRKSQPAPRRRDRSPERSDPYLFFDQAAYVQARAVPQQVPQRWGNVSNPPIPQCDAVPAFQQRPAPAMLPERAPRMQSQPPPLRRAQSPEIPRPVPSMPDRSRPEVVLQRPVTPGALPISTNVLVECTVEFLALRYPRGATLRELRSTWEDWFRFSFEGKTSETLTALRQEGVLTFNGSSFALANMQRWLEEFPRMEALEEAAVTSFLADFISEALRSCSPIELRDLDMDIPLAKFDALPALFPERFLLVSSGVIALPPGARP